MGRKRIWSGEKLAKLRALYPTTSNRKLAKMLGVSRGCVEYQAGVLSLRKSPPTEKYILRFDDGSVKMASTIKGIQGILRCDTNAIRLLVRMPNQGCTIYPNTPEYEAYKRVYTTHKTDCMDWPYPLVKPVHPDAEVNASTAYRYPPLKCFVLVRDREARRELAEWCLSTGGYRWSNRRSMLDYEPVLTARDNVISLCSSVESARRRGPSTDCGEDIEKFKSIILETMNKTL